MRMKLTELTRRQQIALVALMEAVTMAHSDVTEGEEQCIERIAQEIGDDTYRDLIEEADRLFADVEDLKVHLASIEDQAAREIIYGTVWEEAQSDPAFTGTESELLSWLRATWSIESTDA
jgi:uncharacterized tellurite resistance protein B-like protein